MQMIGFDIPATWKLKVGFGRKTVSPLAGDRMVTEGTANASPADRESIAAKNIDAVIAELLFIIDATSIFSLNSEIPSRQGARALRPSPHDKPLNIPREIVDIY